MSGKIMLINPNSNLKGRGIIQPLGIASIAAELEENGYHDQVSLVDGCYLAKKYGYGLSCYKISKEIEKEKPSIVGCSFYHSTVYETIGICLDALKVGADVIVGGHAATADHKSWMQNFYNYTKKHRISSTVAMVRGEGEKTAKELIDALFEGRELYGIKGVTFHNGKEVVVNPDRELVDLNNLHPPALHLLPPIKEYDYELSIEESRGCKYKCSFCSITNFYPYPRLKNPERIRIDAEKAKESGAKMINFISELALWDRDRALKIADIMEEFGYEWKINAHPTLVVKQKDILPTLKQKGLISVLTGIESANISSLKVYNKGTTPKINEEAIKILDDAGIIPKMGFITFQPYMSINDVHKNIIFMISHLSHFSNHYDYPENLSHSWIPDTNTPLYERAKADKIITFEGGKVRLTYRDKKVSEVRKSYHYFLGKYLKQYRLRREKIIRICDADHKNETPYFDKRLDMIGKLPIAVLFISWCCASRDIKARQHIDSLMKQTFEAFDAEYYDAESKIFDNVMDEIQKK
jgi:radical SAM superfamily enzyme YgiQ (UPF0313 family)